VKFEQNTLNQDIFDPELHLKYSKLYYEVNCLGIAASIFALIASFYINNKLKKNKIFSPAIYKGFVYSVFGSILSYVLLLVYFTISLMKIAGANLLSYLKAFKALSKMTSDSPFRNALELVCTFVLLFGLVSILVMSSVVEDEVGNLDKLRQKPKERNTELMSKIETDVEL
jgi:glycerol uptake facilitator-like aquaporin